MNLLVGFGMYDLVALAITTVFTFAASFTLSKIWVFKQAKGTDAAKEPTPIHQA
jgi:putative flippase GtrA